ncbi:hypothetical protein E2C01_053804 [Portunus trituberculatus]|uniref:Uncharacterized protein n=1 Tax=Portunus trituberculatus TaxID=210409 RepID=A0A5B7GQC4_PORTR|nr:hypothetical protein [Portunus trituberculatus]
MHLPHTHPSIKTQNKKKMSPVLVRGPEMSLGRTAHLTTTPDVSTPSIFSTLTSATFAVLDLIFNLWNTTSPLLNLIFSSPKHSCLRQLTVAPFLFSPIFSVLSFVPKLDVASMCATT